MRAIIFILAALLLCAQASAQSFYEKYNDGGLEFPNGYTLVPPGAPNQADKSTAYYKLSGTSTTASNTLRVTWCDKVSITLYQSDPDGTVCKMFVLRHPDAAKSMSSTILGDVNGDGTVNTSDYIALDGDDGNDTKDVDGTDRQTATMYDITGVNFLSLYPTQAPEAGDTCTAEVSCR